MKRWICVLLALCLPLCACGGAPNVAPAKPTAAPATEPPTEPPTEPVPDITVSAIVPEDCRILAAGHGPMAAMMPLPHGPVKA